MAIDVPGSTQNLALVLHCYCLTCTSALIWSLLASMLKEIQSILEKSKITSRYFNFSRVFICFNRNILYLIWNLLLDSHIVLLYYQLHGVLLFYFGHCCSIDFPTILIWLASFATCLLRSIIIMKFESNPIDIKSRSVAGFEFVAVHMFMCRMLIFL